MRLIASFAIALLSASPAWALEIRDWGARDAVMIDLAVAGPTQVGLRRDESGLFLKFSRPLGDARDLNRLAAAYPTLITSIRSSADVILISGPTLTSAKAWSTPNGVRLSIPTATGGREAASDAVQAKMAAERRLEVLRGRVELASGRPEAARAALERAAARQPEDPETLAALAAAERELGREARALAYLDRAISVRPDDPELARDRARLVRDRTSYIEAGVAWRDTEDSDDQATASVRAETRYGARWRLNAAAHGGRLRADAATRADGRTQRVRRNFGRVEAGAGYRWSPDHETEGVLHGAQHGVGVEAAHHVGSAVNQATFGAAWGVPYFDDVAGITDRGRRHSLSAGYERRFDRNWSAGAGGAIRQYGVRGDENVARTAGVTASLRRRIYSDDRFYVDGGYSLDAEYLISDDERTAPGGGFFNPLPIETRETHFADVSATAALSETVSLSGTAGFGADRFGDEGPVVAGSLEWEPSPDWKMGASAGYSFGASRGDNASVTNFGFYVRRRLGGPRAPEPQTSEGAR